MHGVDPAGPFHSSPRVCGCGWQTPQAEPDRPGDGEGRGREEGRAEAQLPPDTGPASRTVSRHKPISSPHCGSHCVKGHLGEGTPRPGASLDPLS